MHIKPRPTNAEYERTHENVNYRISSMERILHAGKRLQLRLDDPDDALDINEIEAAMLATQEEMQLSLRRPLMPETWIARLREFESPIRLDMTPIREVVSIEYYDLDNILTPVPQDVYLVELHKGKTTSDCYINLRRNMVWPSHISTDRTRPIIITLEVGYNP